MRMILFKYVLGEAYISAKPIRDAVANYVNEWFDLTIDLAPFIH